MAFIFLLSLSAAVWGIYHGPLVRWDLYLDPNLQRLRPGLFVGTALSTALGLVGVLLSGLFCAGVIPHGR